MSGAGAFWLIVALCIIGVIVAGVVQRNKNMKIMSTGTEAERAALTAKMAKFAQVTAARKYGAVRLQIVCPHCQERGHVRCKAITSKKGVSGGKATGALLTGGVSMLATGLSRKEAATEAYCENCQSTWHF